MLIMLISADSDQVVQSPHERLKLVLSESGLVHGSERGSGPAHGTSGVRSVHAPVQHDEVLLSSSTAQCRNLK